MVVRLIGAALKEFVPGTIYRNQKLEHRGELHHDVTLCYLGPATKNEYLRFCEESGDPPGTTEGFEFAHISVD